MPHSPHNIIVYLKYLINKGQPIYRYNNGKATGSIAPLRELGQLILADTLLSGADPLLNITRQFKNVLNLTQLQVKQLGLMLTKLDEAQISQHLLNLSALMKPANYQAGPTAATTAVTATATPAATLTAGAAAGLGAGAVAPAVAPLPKRLAGHLGVSKDKINVMKDGKARQFFVTVSNARESNRVTAILAPIVPPGTSITSQRFFMDTRMLTFTLPNRAAYQHLDNQLMPTPPTTTVPGIGN